MIKKEAILTPDQAREIRRNFLAKRNEKPIGFKAAFSARTFGILFPSMRADAQKPISLSPFASLRLENEIAFAACFILGKPISLSEVDLESIAVVMEYNGSVADTGHAKNVPGSPLKVLSWLTKELPKHGLDLKEGDVVLTGAMGKALEARPGTYKADYGKLGTITFTVTD